MVKKSGTIFRLIIPVFLLLSGWLECAGQDDYNSLYYYRFYLKDKGGVTPAEIPASELLSERSIIRRTKNGIPIDHLDLPIYSAYSDTLVNRGLKIACSSKWINTITVSSPIPLDTRNLGLLSFIDTIILVKSPVPVKGSSYYNKEPGQLQAEEAPPYWWQLEMHGADKLHEMGFNGTGSVIAVIDGGFSNADMIESLSPAFSEGRILGTYDFAYRSDDVFSYSQHGTAVLSILAGNWPGRISGSAPGASYWLMRSEVVSSEYPVEEDFWVAAAEFADSAGADIISTSLGYSVFTDGSMDHTYSQMDGKSIFISKGAGIASSRGMIVVTSAGNSRDDPWYYITAPADAENILAVGAVDQSGFISSFSSSGPTFDNRIKPDVSAMGVAVTIQKVPSAVVTGNGTSFSCPLLSGMVACLMQAFPGSTYSEIAEAVKVSADRYLHPDNLYGYGVANIYFAYQYLSENTEDAGEVIHIYPNPSRGQLYLRFNTDQVRVKVRIVDLTGRIVIEREFVNINQPILEIPGFSYLPGGTYIVSVETGSRSMTQKIIRIKE